MAELYLYLWYFVLFGFFGWISEVIYAACIEKKFVNRGFLNGPFCPIYGFGVVVIALCLRGIADNILLLFMGATVLTSILEFITGFVLEKVFHTKWWDYSESKFNFMGYICLSFSLLWGAACTFIVKLVLPALDSMISMIPGAVSVFCFIAIGGILVADMAVTVAALVGLNRQIKLLSKISGDIRTISDRMGEMLVDGVLDAEEKVEALELEKKRAELTRRHNELTKKYEEVLARTDVIKRRLLKAFPDLKKKRYESQQNELQGAILRFAENIETKRKRLVLETYEDSLPKNAERPFAYGLCFNKIFILFMVGNVVGCILETIWCLIVLGHFEMRVGLVYGPFIPVYGFGAVLITLCLYRFYKVRDLWLFLGSAVIGASFEYFASYFQELFLGTVSWDYSNTPFNIDGRTNLMYALIWGVLGLVWVKDIYPIISKTIQKIPKKIGNVLTISLVVFMLFDAVISVSAIVRNSERKEGKPPATEFGVYLDQQFPDDYMEFIYPHMQDAATGVENSGIVHEPADKK